jgi:hypothetical protein
MGFIVPLGLIGNSLAFTVIGRERPFTSTSILIQGLAVADSIVLVTEFLRVTLKRFHYYVALINTYMEFYNMAYGYYMGFTWFANTASIYLTVCIALERFVAVCRPLRAATICTKRKAYIAVVCVFICSFLYRIPYPFAYTYRNYYDPCVGRKRPKSRSSKLYSNKIYFIGYFKVLEMIVVAYVPLTVLVFVTVSVLTALRKSQKSEIAGTPSGQRTDSRNKGRNSATVRVIAVVFVFLILETPGAVYDIVRIVEKVRPDLVSYDWRNPFYYISYFLAVCDSFVNFYVYCATGRRFRRDLMVFLRLRRPDSQNRSTLTSSNVTRSTTVS